MVNFPEISKSKLRQKLLSYFFANLQANLYLREVSAILNEDAGNLSKELVRLEKAGIFVSNSRGKQKYFSLNKNYVLFKELKSVVSKTIGVEASLREIMDSDSGIKTAFVYGSFAQNKETSSSDIDLLLIGKPQESKLMKKIDNLENSLGREINFTVYSEKDFANCIKSKNSFILNLIKRPKIFLKGDLSGF